MTLRTNLMWCKGALGCFGSTIFSTWDLCWQWTQHLGRQLATEAETFELSQILGKIDVKNDWELLNEDKETSIKPADHNNDDNNSISHNARALPCVQNGFKVVGCFPENPACHFSSTRIDRPSPGGDPAIPHNATEDASDIFHVSDCRQCSKSAVFGGRFQASSILTTATLLSECAIAQPK